MRILRFIITVILWVLSCVCVQAQEEFYMSGLLPDNGTYNKLPRKKEMVTKGGPSLPNQYSLKQYCPVVKSQAQFGTCTGWATTYAARTIAEAIRYSWTDRKKITDEAFSPLFVYAQIKNNNDVGCKDGSYIYDALRLLKTTGTLKMSDFDSLCAAPDDISQRMKEAANSYKLDDWCTLFNYECNNKSEKISKVKKSISEQHPVIIAMWLNRSTFRETREVMSLAGVNTDFPTKNPKKEGYHAMCVVGYDDDKYGGAFQIMNSWGTWWGDNGFFWAKYDDFARTVDQAYEITVKPLPQPTPKPEPAPIVQNNYAAKVEMTWKNGKEIKSMLDVEGNMNYYRLYGELHSGDSLKVFISNNEQAYVYVLSSDLNNNVTELFPCPYVNNNDGGIERKNYSPALTYHSNYIALPDESHSIVMDETKGTDYWCILYSKEALDFDSILDKVKTTEGSFCVKVQAALCDKMVPNDDVRFVINNIEFSAKSEKTVVPVIIEAVHN
ncbi:MAG: DUF4384 domain-containing protein [Bacteroidales bacterium]|nr:DUF4384 domain-containing protein [Bacteroidales bacterium]